MTLPPPHLPHVTQQQGSSQRVLAVASLAMGLIAVLTLVVAVLYARSGLIVSAFFGVIAGGVAVAALVMKHRPLGAAITGLTTGVIAVIVSIVVMVASLVPPILQIGEVNPLPGGASPSPGDALVPETIAPDSDASFEIPQHMSSGGVLFGFEMVPVLGSTMDPAVGPVVHDHSLTDATVDIVVYVDYRCPYCLAFDQAQSQLLQEATATGRATVEVRPLTFMDRQSEGSAYSSRASALLACTVDTQPEHAWLTHSLLLTPEVQPVGHGPGLSNDELLTLAEIVMPVSDELRSCVLGERFVPFVQAVNEWTFAHPVLGAKDADVMVTGTPMVFIEGDLYDDQVLDAQVLRAHLTALGVFADMS